MPAAFAFSAMRFRRLPGAAVGAVLQRRAHVFLERRCSRQHAIAARSRDLRIDMAVCPMDREPDRVLLTDPDPRLARPAQPRGIGIDHGLVPRYFFFVSFKTMVSFA
jgi:hypothetical protein